MGFITSSSLDVSQLDRLERRRSKARGWSRAKRCRSLLMFSNLFGSPSSWSLSGSKSTQLLNHSGHSEPQPSKTPPSAAARPAESWSARVRRRTLGSSASPGQAELEHSYSSSSFRTSDASVSSANAGQLDAAARRRLLEELDEPLPPHIRLVLADLYRRGPSTVGVFRKSPNARHLRELRRKLDRAAGSQSAGADDCHSLRWFAEELASYQVNVVVSLLKEWLRSQSDCLLGAKLFADWIQLAKQIETSSRLLNERVAGLLSSLGAYRLSLLRSLLCVLRRIASQSDHNKMTPLNLGVCVGQSLLVSTTHQLDPKQLQSATELSSKYVPPLIAYLIEQAPALFGHRLLSICSQRLAGDQTQQVPSDQSMGSDLVTNANDGDGEPRPTINKNALLSPYPMETSTSSEIERQITEANEPDGKQDACCPLATVPTSTQVAILTHTTVTTTPTINTTTGVDELDSSSPILQAQTRPMSASESSSSSSGVHSSAYYDSNESSSRSHSSSSESDTPPASSTQDSHRNSTPSISSPCPSSSNQLKLVVPQHQQQLLKQQHQTKSTPHRVILPSQQQHQHRQDSQSQQQQLLNATSTLGAPQPANNCCLSYYTPWQEPTRTHVMSLRDYYLSLQLEHQRQQERMNLHHLRQQHSKQQHLQSQQQREHQVAQHQHAHHQLRQHHSGGSQNVAQFPSTCQQPTQVPVRPHHSQYVRYCWVSLV